MNRCRQIPIIGNPDAGCLPSPLEFDPRPKPRSILRALRGLAGLLAFTTIVVIIWTGVPTPW